MLLNDKPNTGTTHKISKKKIEIITKRSLKSKGHSDSMIKKILRPSGKYLKHYEKKDICDAMVLRSISKKGYEFVRKNLNVPMPSKGYLEKTFKNFDTSPGIQEDMLDLLRSKFKDNKDFFERQAILVFDEMELKE